MEGVPPDGVKDRTEAASPGAEWRHAAAGTGGGDSGGDRPDAGASVVPSWLLRAKVVMPQPVPGYVSRGSLARELAMVLERRLTVLQAPAGFGKTTVLSDLGRRIAAQGHLVGWLSLDEDDTPSAFGSYVTYAFECAGLDLAAVADRREWSSSPIVQRLGLLARAIEKHGAPCLLALDEVERLPRHTVGLIDLLLQHAPPNLHFVASFRSNPGMDISAHILNGSAVVVDVPAFRFARHEIAEFFRGDLSRRKLAAVERRSAGWPVALMVYRKLQVREAEPSGAATSNLTSNFVGVRLLRDLSAKDRTFLMDLAVFDWIDADIVDEVLGSSDARLRIAALSALDGLLMRSDDDHAVQHLHPLVREYCVAEFAVENPERKRTLHARIARTMHGRGLLMQAWRHARNAGDFRLVGDLIESVGVLGLWARGGNNQVVAADRFQTTQVVEAYPRLALLRCVALKLTSKPDEAAALYETVGRRTDGFTRDRDGGDADALSCDRLFAKIVLEGGTRRLGREALDAALPAGETASGDDQLSRFQSAVLHALHCVANYERTRFDACGRHGQSARAHLGEEARYCEIHVGVYLGMAAMAQGRVDEAADQYRRARQSARRFFAADRSLAAITEVVTIELELERNREKAIQQRTLPGMEDLRTGWSEIYAAAVDVRAELTCAQYGAEAAVKFLRQTIDDDRATHGRSTARHLSALLASYLLLTGRGDEAANVWLDGALPSSDSELLDLNEQPWRTMEALSCARVRLLVEQGRHAAADELAEAMARAASARGLTRTALRSQALSMVVACSANKQDLAVERLAAYLRRARDVGYFRPLARDSRASVAVLRRLLDNETDADIHDAAESMLGSLDKRSTTAELEFSAREQEILSEVRCGRRNKEIATNLGITEEGVRYHLKKIYRKTGVSGRSDAVRYALDKGILT